MVRALRADGFLDRYVAKVIFTYILGYKVDVGHMEAVNLISSPKYSEKQIVSTMSTGSESCLTTPSRVTWQSLSLCTRTRTFYVS